MHGNTHFKVLIGINYSIKDGTPCKTSLSL